MNAPIRRGPNAAGLEPRLDDTCADDIPDIVLDQPPPPEIRRYRKRLWASFILSVCAAIIMFS
jgi:hypothetical protein